jgi:N-acetylmuramoyl-L-alanine amidase
LKKYALRAALALFLTAVALVTVLRGVNFTRARPSRSSIAALSESAYPTLTLILDPGHGGSDGGAVSENGTVESALNLDIARRADALLAFFGVRTVLTRASEELTYSSAATTLRARKTEDQKARLALIRATPNAALISIHQNKYPQPGPFGAQVLYAPTAGSETFGKNMQTLLVASLDAGNRRGAVRIQDTIYLMNNIACPAILIECGFLSNPREETLLNTDAYRLRLAAVIAAGYLREEESLAALYITS